MKTTTGKSISLVLADTENHVLAKAAVKHCISKFNFDRVIIFTNAEEYWNGYNPVIIPRIESLPDYNKIIINSLPDYLETDYCIIAQFDGFILNPEEFSPHFFHYDYIGAPWHQHSNFNVGNGGFSWRSRKLVESASNLPFNGLEPEDEFICRTSRNILEDKFKCHFATESIASHFSFEYYRVRYPTFGFHGAIHLPSIYRNILGFLIDNLSETSLISRASYLLPLIEAHSKEAGTLLRNRLDHIKRTP